MQRDVAAGVAGAVGAQVLVGSSAAVSALLVRYPVLGGQGIRYAAAAAVLFGLMRLRGLPYLRVDRPDAVRLVLLAATGLVGFNLFLLGALRYASPAGVGAVLGCTPVALALATPLLRRQRPTPRMMAAALLVCLGAGIAQGFGPTTLPGLVLSLGTLACEVLFSLLAVPLLPKLGPLRVSAYACAIGAPMSLLAGALVDGPARFLREPTVSEAIGYIVLVVTVVAFIVWYAALPRLGADRAGLFTGLVPLAAAGSSYLVGTGRPGPPELLGACLVGAGVLLGLSGGPHSPRPPRRNYPDRWSTPPSARTADARVRLHGDAAAGSGPDPVPPAHH